METTRINIRLSVKQHQMLSELADHTGLNMTAWIQHQILNHYDLMKKQENLPNALNNLSKLVNDVQNLKPDQLSIFNQEGTKG